MVDSYYKSKARMLPKAVKDGLQKYPLLGWILIAPLTYAAYNIGSWKETDIVITNVLPPVKPEQLLTTAFKADIGGADHDVLGGTWSEQNHEVACKHNEVRLERDAKDALIDYNEQISLGASVVEFTIIPSGKYAYNIGYGRRTLYEFMFGDGDKSKVSLKYDANHDGQMEFVSLYGEIPYSKQANGVFINDLSQSSEIRVRVTESLVGSSKFQLTLVLNDEYTFTSDALPLLNSSQYNRVYISMVDYTKDGDNQTGAEFPDINVCPLV